MGCLTGGPRRSRLLCSPSINSIRLWIHVGEEGESFAKEDSLADLRRPRIVHPVCQKTHVFCIFYCSKLP
ncbi:hypothetical protein CY35_05G035500 [Sphagnum magellanicum]|nr:hypothetical protein CY35_05G035500 [Sphagnum magellanicum]